MEKLNELVKLAGKVLSPENAFEDVDAKFEWRAKASPTAILAIAEAFRALEQRAEAAEARAKNLNDGWLNAISERDEARAKLAELEKQEPASSTTKAQLDIISDGSVGSMFASKDMPVKLFTRPAPAINLEELVPHCLVDAMSNLNLEGVSIGDKAIIGKAIEVLRNTEEAK